MGVDCHSSAQVSYCHDCTPLSCQYYFHACLHASCSVCKLRDDGQASSLQENTRRLGHTNVRNLSMAKNIHLTHKSAVTYYFDYNTVEIILIGCSIFLALVAIMFESGKFFYMDPVTGIETINADPSSQVFYNTVLVFAGVTLFGSLLYYFIVFCAEVLGRLPSWFIKCCADKKRNKLDSFRMDNSIKFEDNPWAGGHIKEIKSAQKEEAKNKEELTALKAHREQ